MYLKNKTNNNRNLVEKRITDSCGVIAERVERTDKTTILTFISNTKILTEIVSQSVYELLFAVHLFL